MWRGMETGEDFNGELEGCKRIKREKKDRETFSPERL